MAAKSQEPEPTVPRLFTELQLSGEDGDYEAGLRLAEEILSRSPEDKDALHCRIVCLIQLSKFHEAIKLIDKKAEKQKFQFERAYCFYRLEKYDESRRALKKLPESEQRVRELSAQIAYRVEGYEEARKLYTSLVKESSDDFGNEREANYAAALSLCKEMDEIPHLEAIHRETMEQCFNLACCYLTFGNGREAAMILHKAEELCRESLLEEDYTEEEIESELSVIRIQLGFALQIQHQGKEAASLYGGVLKQKPTDVSHSVIASNNIVVFNKDRDVFDSKKKMKVLANEGSSKKLTQFQKLLILYNRCLFSLQINQLDQCQQLVTELKSKHPTSELTVLAEAALLNREKKTAACLKLLETHLQRKPDSSVLLYTTLAQLNLAHGNVTKVCSTLRSIPNVWKHVGIVSALVSLHTHEGGIDAAIEILDETVTWWSKQQQKSEQIQKLRRSVMMENAQYKLRHGRPEAAALVLEKLRSEYPSHLQVQVLLISAYSQYDSRKAEEQSQSLPSFASSSTADVDTLEQMLGFKLTRRQLLKPDTTEKQADKKDHVPKERKRKKRKPKLPKNYDPTVPPDPERWLPLKERSYYRRGKKKGFIALRGTQGSSAASALLTAQLDASKPKPSAQESTGKQHQFFTITFRLMATNDGIFVPRLSATHSQLVPGRRHGNKLASYPAFPCVRFLSLTV